jgi:hypothetical protein
MAFTSWAEIRTALKAALADYAGGAPMHKEYQINGRRTVFREAKEIEEMISMTYRMEALENSGDQASMTSYGRYER